MKSATIVLLALAIRAFALPSIPLAQEHQAEERDIGPQPGLVIHGAVLQRRETVSTTRTSSTTTKRASSTTTTRTSSTTTKRTSSTTTKLTSSTTTAKKTTTTTKTTTGKLTVDAAIQTPTSTTTTLKTTTTTTTPKTTTTTTTTKKTSTTTTSATQPTKTLNVSNMSYQQAMLTVHNLHRSNHSLPDLVWSQSLANTAQKIADSCKYGHNVDEDGGGYGQNIGAGAPGNSAAGLITNLMYNGEINYYPQPYGNDDADLTNFHIWGHYSQMVWSDTTDIGCVTKYCPGGLGNTPAGVAPYFTVCNFYPPGNYVGEFSSVAAPKGGGATYVVVGGT